MSKFCIEKKFHFYAAHRNEEITGKCQSLHGHRYGVSVLVQEPQVGSVTILFDDLEQKVQSLLRQMDHAILLHRNDPAAEALVNSGACSRVYYLDEPTSAENLARHILVSLRELGLNVLTVCLQETDTSVVSVSYDDL